jgi:hypothetical protein
VSNKDGACLIAGEGEIELRLHADAKFEAASGGRDEQSRRRERHRNASIGLRDARPHQPLVSKREKNPAVFVASSHSRYASDIGRSLRNRIFSKE